jgi:hypothetical protein
VAQNRFAQEHTIGEVSDNELTPFDRFDVATRNIVVNDGRKPGLPQRLAGVAADVSSPTRNQDAISTSHIPITHSLRANLEAAKILARRIGLASLSIARSAQAIDELGELAFMSQPWPRRMCRTA